MIAQSQMFLDGNFYVCWRVKEGMFLVCHMLTVLKAYISCGEGVEL